VFQQALANLPRFEWRGVPFAAWLYRIAANALADHWRRLGREVQDPPAELPDEHEHEDLLRRMSLFQLVDRLPDLQRRVIEMRFVQDKSTRDVAVALDRSEGAVKQLQLRALQNLRKGMGLDG
jgi:RNA polymerase sigma-70 factor (ECF subfamily)